jgi:hypothetical protein
LWKFGERCFTEIVQRDCKDPRPIRRYLDKEIYPRLADKAVRDITLAEVQAIVFRKRGRWRTFLSRTDPQPAQENVRVSICRSFI